MKNSEKKKQKDNLVIPIILAVITIAFLLYFLKELRIARGYFANEAKYMASDLTVDFAKTIDDSVRAPVETIESIASLASNIHGFDEIDDFGNEQADKYKINCLQFLNDGEAEYRYGKGVGSATAPEIVALVGTKKSGCSKIYSDYALGTLCVAVYSPVVGNDDIDGALAYYTVSDTLISRGKINDKVSFYCLAELAGPIVEQFSRDGFQTSNSHDVYTYLLDLCEDKNYIDEIRFNNEMRVCKSYDVFINKEEYIVSSALVKSYGTDCFVTNVYSQRELLHDKYVNYDRMFGAAVGLIIISVATLVAFIIIRHMSHEQIVIMDEYDPVLSCNKYNKFKNDAQEILSKNKLSNYAIVYSDVNKFSYIKENFGEQTSEDALRYISMLIKKTTGTNETYGHVLDDRFVRLIHYSDSQELADKIRLMEALSSNFGPAQNTDYTLKLSVGIYIIDRDKDKDCSVDLLVERAIIAQKANKKNSDKAFTVFDTNIRSDYVKEAEIESKMDTALKNHEFKVFYQPKYNISKDRIDGAEALVRWYDEKQNAYVRPDDFVPLFEVNGFIIRLDRYVFLEVCSYMSESVKRGERVVPISVNVSRVSATQPDFLQYYVDAKNRFSIPNNFITIEFTESFACESNELIAKIVNELNKNGFKCSVDDFGSGYSSLAVLKELQVYELKLDKFFIKPGTDSKRDEILLKTIIQLGKDFGMSITQEGIETIEELNYLSTLHCDIIQGYLYSKPLSLSDYIAFVNGDTSLSGVVGKKAFNQ